MKLSEAKMLFKKQYPNGFITKGKNVGGCKKSRWAVCFNENDKIYEYAGTLRNVLIKILPMSEKDKDLLWNIIGRCDNGCPIEKNGLSHKHGYCVNCGSKIIHYW